MLVGSDTHNGRRARILGHQSILWPDSLDVMGWRLGEEGLEVIISRDIPTIVTRQLGPVVHDFFAVLGSRRDRCATTLRIPVAPR